LYFAPSDRLSVYCGYWTTKRDAFFPQRVTDQAQSRAIHICGRP